ncbi:Endonuclease/exonuclease/phosphatase [Choanephora cucurbitarum]|nr:Endonuclease/exonuclease/phosphatase [Choanephora cucurbitarum]
MYSSGNTPYNTSPASSPSVVNAGVFGNRYSLSLQQSYQHQQTQPQQNPSLIGTPTDVSASPSATPHLARQITYAQISRQSSSPHHHARAAAAMARNTPVTSTVTITDPNDPNKLFNSRGTYRKKEEEPEHVWTSLDMGGMGLKNIAPTICSYHFLTALYINHNNLTYLMPSLSQLTNLKILDVSGNKLSLVPPELGLLCNLRELLLFDNNLVSLPTEFGNLYQLETLGLEGNPLQADLKNILIKDGTQALIMSLRENAPVGMPPPHREWLLIEGDTMEDPDKFTVLCYNILCQKYATPQAYGYTPSWALSWEYRKELLVAEILGYNADIFCLQEMEMGSYHDYFKDHFKKMGDYDSVFIAKTRAKTMSEKERRVVDGCATFYKASRFQLIDQELVEYNQKALQRPDFKQTVDIYNRVMNKDNVAALVILQDKNTHQRMLVANTHIHWVPSDADVKLVQVGVLMDEIQKLATKHLAPIKGMTGPTYGSVAQLPTVICGDFNSVPDSGVYEFFSKGAIQQDHDDFGDHSYGTYTTEGLSHPLSLKSSYSHMGELPFTNYTPGFKGVLDYAWYTTNTLDVISLLGPIDTDYLSKVVGLPNAHFPSDHIAIMSELKYKSQNNNRKEPVKADFNSTRHLLRSKYASSSPLNLLNS